MSYNLSRVCLCAHRHSPGSCPVLSCGCGELRPDMRVREEPDDTETAAREKAG